MEMFKIIKGTAPTLELQLYSNNNKKNTDCKIVLILQSELLNLSVIGSRVWAV